jgi:MraZ protein
LFSGGSEHSVDEKGRIVIPIRFREELGANFVVTKGMSRCLIVMTKKYWDEKFNDIFESKSMMDEASNYLLHHFYAEAAADSNIDGQGRVALPSALREYAGIKPESPAMVLGVFNRLEIWSKERWTAKTESVNESSLASVAELVGVGKATARP